MRNKQLSEYRGSKLRHKMYKSGKNWVFAGITAVTLGVGGAMVSNTTNAHADTVNNKAITVTSQSNVSPSGAAKLQSSAQSSANSSVAVTSASETSVSSVAQSEVKVSSSDNINDSQAVQSSNVSQSTDVSSTTSNDSSVTTKDYEANVTNVSSSSSQVKSVTTTPKSQQSNLGYTLGSNVSKRQVDTYQNQIKQVQTVQSKVSKYQDLGLSDNDIKTFVGSQALDYRDGSDDSSSSSAIDSSDQVIMNSISDLATLRSSAMASANSVAEDVGNSYTQISASIGNMISSLSGSYDLLNSGYASFASIGKSSRFIHNATVQSDLPILNSLIGEIHKSIGDISSLNDEVSRYGSDLTNLSSIVNDAEGSMDSAYAIVTSNADSANSYYNQNNGIMGNSYRAIAFSANNTVNHASDGIDSTLKTLKSTFRVVESVASPVQQIFNSAQPNFTKANSISSKLLAILSVPSELDILKNQILAVQSNVDVVAGRVSDTFGDISSANDSVLDYNDSDEFSMTIDSAQQQAASAAHNFISGQYANSQVQTDVNQLNSHYADYHRESSTVSNVLSMATQTSSFASLYDSKADDVDTSTLVTVPQAKSALDYISNLYTTIRSLSDSMTSDYGVTQTQSYNADSTYSAHSSMATNIDVLATTLLNSLYATSDGRSFISSSLASNEGYNVSLANSGASYAQSAVTMVNDDTSRLQNSVASLLLVHYTNSSLQDELNNFSNAISGYLDVNSSTVDSLNSAYSQVVSAQSVVAEFNKSTTSAINNSKYDDATNFVRLGQSGAESLANYVNDFKTSVNADSSNVAMAASMVAQFKNDASLSTPQTPSANSNSNNNHTNSNSSNNASSNNSANNSSSSNNNSSANNSNSDSDNNSSANNSNNNSNNSDSTNNSNNDSNNNSFNSSSNNNDSNNNSSNNSSLNSASSSNSNSSNSNNPFSSSSNNNNFFSNTVDPGFYVASNNSNSSSTNNSSANDNSSATNSSSAKSSGSKKAKKVAKTTIYPIYRLNQSVSIKFKKRSVKLMPDSASTFVLLKKTSLSHNRVKLTVLFHGERGYIVTEANKIKPLYYGADNNKFNVKKFSENKVIAVKTDLAQPYLGKKVVVKHAIYSYKKTSLTKASRSHILKANAKFRIRNLYQKNNRTIFELSNGYYITANSFYVNVVK